MGFILDGLDSENYDRTYGDRELVRRIIRYFRPYRRQMAVVSVMLALGSLVGTAGPILISKALDVAAARPTLGVLAALSGAVLLLGALGWTFNFVRQRLSARVIGDAVLKLQEDTFSAAIRHDLSFFDAHPSGKIVSRITSDTQDFSNVVSLVMDLANQFLLVVVLTVWLLRINAFLTLLLVAMAPVAVAIALGFRALARRVTQHSRRATATINAQIQESIRGIVVAKGFRRERAIYETFSDNNARAYQVGVRRGVVLNLIFPILGAAQGLGTAALIYAGAMAMRQGSMTPGTWYLFMQAVGFFWWPLINIASFWSQFQDGLSAAERVFALIDAEPKVTQTGSQSVGRLEGGVELRGIGLRYDTGEPVLRGFDLSVRPRETLALVGHTGAGKTSIARLICRFYEFQEGELLVDGKDIRSFSLDDYRSRVGYVPQDPFLFSTSVLENIRYGKEGASDEEVRRAASHIAGGDWVEDLPAGLATDAGERGANLSMGQRQLVALARVLLKDPAIFILDEATSSVDPFTEAQIQEGLSVLMRDRTAIVIAHRLSTVKHADRILVLDHGQIVEEGAHEELLRRGGRYAALYNTYFRHQSIEYIESVGDIR